MDNFIKTTFAGFKLPRTSNGPTIYNPTAHYPSLARFKAWKANNKGRGCIGQVTYPNRIRSAETAATFKGWGCYISGAHRLDDRWFDLRWAYVDEIPDDWYSDDDSPVSIDHSGWFLDDDTQDDLARGIVVKLPARRGFLAGWTLGPGMVAELDITRYLDLSSAAMAADSMAEDIAEREREYRAERCEECGQHPEICECEEE